MPEEVNIDDLIDLRTDEERIQKLKVRPHFTCVRNFLCLGVGFLLKEYIIYQFLQQSLNFTCYCIIILSEIR